MQMQHLVIGRTNATYRPHPRLPADSPERSWARTAPPEKMTECARRIPPRLPRHAFRSASPEWLSESLSRSIIPFCEGYRALC